MLCRNPYAKGPHLFPCGQCMPCRFNRRRVWTHRIMLEAMLKPDNAFVTLTYSDEFLHWTDGGLPTLWPKDFQLFLKRLRKLLEPVKIRFFGCGEYGDASERPHYHLAVFGLPKCGRGNTRFSDEGRCCPSCDAVQAAWGKGRVFLGDLSVHSAQYVAGYVTKKMTDSDDDRLVGRHPEFSRMSLRPGIGHDFMDEVASSLLSYDLDDSLPDVPSVLRHGMRQMPLGRYLRRRLRVLIGRSPDTPEVVLAQMAEEVRALHEASREAPQGFRQKEFARLAVEDGEGKFRQFEARGALYKKRRSL